MTWASEKLSFVGIENYGPSSLALGAANFGLSNSSSGKLSFSWNDPNLSGISLPDSTILFKIRFTSLGVDGISNLQFSNSPTLIEAINKQMQPVSVIQTNGISNIACESPNSLQLFSSSTTANCSTFIDLPIRVKNFNDLTSLQFTYGWDKSRFKFDSLINLNNSPLNLSLGNFGTSLSDSGKLMFSWYDSDLIGKTLKDSSILFTIRFSVLSIPGKSAIQFLNTPAIIEAINSNNKLVNVTAISNEIEIKCTQSSLLQVYFKDSTVNCGELIEIPLRVNGFRSLISYQGTISWDPTKLSYDSISNYGPSSLNQSLSNFGTTLISSGKLVFSWNENSLKGLSFNDSTVLFSVRFKVIGISDKSDLKLIENPTSIEFVTEQLQVIKPLTSNGFISIKCGSCTASISKDTEVCLNSSGPPSVVLTGSGGIAPYVFTYNINGGLSRTVTSTGNSISIVPDVSSPGDYIYNLTNVTSLGCTQPLNLISIIKVTSPKTAGVLNGAQSICVGGSSTFSSTVSGGVWSSSNLGIALVNASSGVITGVSAGTSTITYTVSGTGGCATAISTKLLTVNNTSAGILSGAQSICVGGSSVFSSSVSGGSWSSSNPEIASINPTSGIVTGISAGTATLTYTASNTSGCLSAFATKSLSVNNISSAGVLSGAQSICVGGSSTFSSTVSGGVWSSSNVGIAAVNPSSGIITGISAGTITITYTVSGTGGCAATISTKLLTVNNTSAGILSGVQSICVGKNATFSSTVSGGVWSSSNTGIAAINASSGLVTGVASGISTITYTIAGSVSCPAVLSSYSLVVAQLPVAQIQTPLTNFICQNSDLLLVANGGDTYKWFIDNTEILGANTNKFNATKPGSYFVQTISKEGCVSEKSVSLILTLVSMPEVDFSNDKYCAKTLIQFSNLSKVSNSGLVSYNWSFGDGSNSAVANPTYTFSKEGLYTVTLSITPIACPNLISQKTKNIVIEINPGNIRYKAVDILIGQTVQLASRTFQNATYDWSPVIGLNNYKIFNPIFNLKQGIDYKIKIVNQAGCGIVDTQLVRVFDRVEIYVPDAFSPNSDSKNDRLIPKLIGIQKLNYFKIFNRWGQTIFSSNKEGEGWDGFYNGLKQQIDTYAWQCEGVDLKGDIIRRSGTFILIR